MKKKRSLVAIIIFVLIIIGVAFGTFKLLNDKNKLTVAERRWVNDNINKVQNLNVVNDALVFGNNGSGIFYDFLTDFQKHYGLKINPITYNAGAIPSGISFGIKTKTDKNDVVFYTDHYVLISKNNVIVTDLNSLTNVNVGILNSDYAYLTSYLQNRPINYIQAENIDNLYKLFEGDTEYIIVPLIQYLDKLLATDYSISYHFGDINIYYVLQLQNDSFSNVLKKYFVKWENKLNESFNTAEFGVFKKALKISDSEADKLQSLVYKYGFVNNSPYEVIMGGEYGGIVAVYLQHFSDFANVEFSFNKYKNYDKFLNAVNDNKIDVFFNYYNLNNKYITTDGANINYALIARRDNNSVINSIYSLSGKEVYVLKDSKIYNYLKGIGNIYLKTYSDSKELFKLNKKDVYIAIDELVFDYYSSKELNNYTKRYSNSLNEKYEFKVKDNEILAKLMKKYINTLDAKKIINIGIENHYDTIKSGTFISTIAKYILYLLIIAVLIILIIVRKSRKITIARKIKKDDKMKFIDQLTSLKNRNYLNENIEVWNNNTIYPQTIIVVDLNKLQEINDINGYNEGDRQIQAAANALIKTQLDNSEIMRTDGNEFVIYLVGYTQKQVTNYMHKLNKELNKLPYQFGAEFGYSMITDNIKTIEDAMNEAVEDMKKEKESNES